MATTIAVFNQKGGVGKTTTSINLSSGLAKKGCRVLLIDLDPQANATYGLGLSVDESIPHIASVLEQDRGDISKILVDIEPNLQLAPANILLANTSEILYTRSFREHVLSRVLKPMKEIFDYIIVDCQPSLGVLPINALCASNRCLVPTGLDSFSLIGFANLVSTIHKLRNDDDDFDYRILATKVTARYEETQLEAIRALDPVKDRILNSQIALNIAIGRSQMEKDNHRPCSVLNSETRSKGAKDYRALVKEILKIWPPDLSNGLQMRLQANQS